MCLNMDRNTIWGSAGGMVFENDLGKLPQPFTGSVRMDPRSHQAIQMSTISVGGEWTKK